eukprot:5050000-Lingulodinium_polyedra.AAC.1
MAETRPGGCCCEYLATPARKTPFHPTPIRPISSNHCCMTHAGEGRCTNANTRWACNRWKSQRGPTRPTPLAWPQLFAPTPTTLAANCANNAGDNAIVPP